MPYVQEPGVWRFANGVKLWKRDLLIDQLRLYRQFVGEGLNFHEPEEERHFVSALRPRGVFLDIGAGVGYYSILARRLHPRLRVEAFNPDPIMRGQMVSNLALNRTGGVRIHPLALSDFEGDCHLHKVGDYSGYLAPEGGSDSLPVPVARLDRFLPQVVGRIVLAKLDVQGAELAVLRGAGAQLHRLRRVLVGTHSPELHAGCLAFLKENGFRILFEAEAVERQYDGLIVARSY